MVRQISLRNAIPVKLIASCGLNCRLCRAYIRKRNPCPGCRAGDENKSGTCLSCRIKNCDKISDGLRYCFSCDNFPCDIVDRLDNRYRKKYGISVIQNLKSIKAEGIRQFIRKERIKWRCPECNAMICVHKPQCVVCGHYWR